MFLGPWKTTPLKVFVIVFKSGVEGTGHPMDIYLDPMSLGWGYISGLHRALWRTG
jgi:hypothetical protein